MGIIEPTLVLGCLDSAAVVFPGFICEAGNICRVEFEVCQRPVEIILACELYVHMPCEILWILLRAYWRPRQRSRMVGSKRPCLCVKALEHSYVVLILVLVVYAHIEVVLLSPAAFIMVYVLIVKVRCVAKVECVRLCGVICRIILLAYYDARVIPCRRVCRLRLPRAVVPPVTFSL